MKQFLKLFMFSLLLFFLATCNRKIAKNEVVQTWIFTDPLTGSIDSLTITIDPTKYTEQQYIETYTYCYQKWLNEVRKEPKQFTL